MYYTVPPQGGRRYIVTGANSGTGGEVARPLARAGAEVVLAVRAFETLTGAFHDLPPADSDE